MLGSVIDSCDFLQVQSLAYLGAVDILRQWAPDTLVVSDHFTAWNV